jgi:hypothetical protein
MTDEWFTNQKFFISNFCVLQTKKLTPPFLSLFGKVCGRVVLLKTKQNKTRRRRREEEGILPHHIPIIIIIIITKMTT